MHNLRRFYYQNKAKIWKIILIIVFILGIIYFLDNLEGSGETESSKINWEENYVSDNPKVYIENNSAITGEKMTNSEKEEVDNIIGTFIEHCKNQEAEVAYNMLSEECKKERYTTIDIFTEEYLNTREFKYKKYNIKKYKEQLYEVIIKEDYLATGNINNKSEEVEYIAIVKENGTERLNVNNFIKAEEINKTGENKSIKITVNKRQIYMNYEVYEFVIENKTNKEINLISGEEGQEIYLKGGNGNKTTAYIYELLQEELHIDAKRTHKIKIKFAKEYTNTKKVSQIVFENIIIGNKDENEHTKVIINL